MEQEERDWLKSKVKVDDAFAKRVRLLVRARYRNLRKSFQFENSTFKSKAKDNLLKKRTPEQMDKIKKIYFM